jgi:hypothetical protein
MTGPFILVLAALFAAIALIWFFRSRTTTEVVRNPTLGMLDLSRGSAHPDLESDKAVLGDLFSSVAVSLDRAPHCNVLFIYGSIDGDGSIRNSQAGLRELIRDSGAVVAVVATNNSGQNYIKAGAKKPYGSANLVLTLDRKGTAFSQFLYQLFTAMKRGTSMPVAWVRLAPQHESQDANLPETIFACERGQVCFA